MASLKLGLGAALLLVCGCGPQRPAMAPLLPSRDVTVYVAVTDQVAKTDTGNIAAMVDALEADLRKQGHVVTIVAARSDERPPASRLELQVMQSESGDAALRGAGNLVGFFGVAGVSGSVVAIGGGTLAAVNGGTMLVDAYIVHGDAQPALYLGRIASRSSAGTTNEAVGAGAGAGHAIAHRTLTGPPPPRSESAASAEPVWH